MTDLKALNQKLAKWAGFTFLEQPLPRGKTYKSWHDPNGDPAIGSDLVAF